MIQQDLVSPIEERYWWQKQVEKKNQC